MPKSLGQIHTVPYNYEMFATATGNSNAFLADLSQSLSKQFQRNIRQMCNYKVVGIDLVAQLPEGSQIPNIDATAVLCKGRIRFFQSTKARCDAARVAYQQMRNQMKMQGVDPSKNKLYDFRFTPRGLSNYPHNTIYHPIYNLATLDGSTTLAAIDNGGAEFEIFTSYNESVNPTEGTSSTDFPNGLRTQIGASQTDFVLNEGTIQDGNPQRADVLMEEIPFALSYDSTSKTTTTLQWRPDPALYLNVMFGHIEIVIDECTATGAVAPDVGGLEVDLTVHVAGWKSIVKSPRKRKSMTVAQQRRHFALQREAMKRK